MNKTTTAIYISATMISLAILCSTAHGFSLIKSTGGLIPVIIIVGWIILAILANLGDKNKEELSGKTKLKQ